MLKLYDRLLASQYAQKWALDRNPKYYAFDKIGGDCTNYISQCLIAGGGVMDFDKYYGWYYNSQFDRSPSWTSVEYLQRFLLNNTKKGPVATIKNIKDLQVGDLLQLRQTTSRFNHTLFISQISNGNIFVCAHDDDSLNRPLSSYNYISIMGLHILGVYDN